MYLAIYSSARRALSFLFSSANSSGLGTIPVMGTTSCGEVPHETVGTMSLALRKTSSSYFAPSSDFKLVQYFTAFFHSGESTFGDKGLPFRYSNVVSSGAIIPALAPASIDILHIDILASILSPRIADPQNSITAPVPPAVPMTPIVCRIISLLLTPGDKTPSTCILIFLLRFVISVWVASTCSTSLVPIPKAKAPKAPCVDV